MPESICEWTTLTNTEQIYPYYYITLWLRAKPETGPFTKQIARHPFFPVGSVTFRSEQIKNQLQDSLATWYLTESIFCFPSGLFAQFWVVTSTKHNSSLSATISYRCVRAKLIGLEMVELFYDRTVSVVMHRPWIRKSRVVYKLVIQIRDQTHCW